MIYFTFGGSASIILPSVTRIVSFNYYFFNLERSVVSTYARVVKLLTTGSYHTSPPHREKLPLRLNDPGEIPAANDRVEIYFFSTTTYKYIVQTIFFLSAPDSFGCY